jgi:hypothetical protein
MSKYPQGPHWRAHYHTARDFHPPTWRAPFTAHATNHWWRSIESAAMHAAEFLSFLPALLFGLPLLIWYAGVLILLFKIWQELKAIRLSRSA